MDYTLAVTILYVQDIAQERRFYHETLGLPIDEAQSSADFVMLKPGGPTRLALQSASTATEKTAPAGSAMIGLLVDDVDRVWREWKSKGVKLLTEPQDLPFGRNFDARDPEGHYLSVFKPPMG